MAQDKVDEESVDKPEDTSAKEYKPESDDLKSSYTARIEELGAQAKERVSDYMDDKTRDSSSWGVLKALRLSIVDGGTSLTRRRAISADEKAADNAPAVPPPASAAQTERDAGSATERSSTDSFFAEGPLGEMQAREKQDTDQRRDMLAFADSKFASLDADHNDFISKEELDFALSDKTRWNENEYKSLVMMHEHFDSIRAAKRDDGLFSDKLPDIGQVTDNEGLTRADFHKWSKDQSDRPEYIAICKIDRDIERDRLDKALDSHSPPLPEATKAEFRQNMKEFEERARERGLGTEEVAKTYRETSRILEAEGDKPMTPDERGRIACQVMDQAAHPTTIDQGAHDTCNVATVETVMYTKEPSSAAKLVADVATTGEYTTADGTNAKLDEGSLRPDREAMNEPIGYGDRTYASQIFQVTAINLHCQQACNGWQYRSVPGTTSERGKPMEKTVDLATGEDLTDGEGKPMTVPDDFTDDQIARTYFMISENREDDVFLDLKGHKKAQFVTDIRDKSELDAKLAEMKEQDSLPVIVGVHTANEPFWTDSGGGTAGGAGGETGGGHVVTITDYDPGPPSRVEIDNQWGEGNDHRWSTTDASGNKSIDPSKGVLVHDLFIAMHDPEESRELLRHDVEWNRSHNEIETDKEIELLRMECITGEITQEEYVEGLQQSITDADRRWKEGSYDPAEKAEGTARIRKAIDELPPEQRLKVLHGIARTDVLTEEQYESAVEDATRKALLQKRVMSRQGRYDEEQQERYAKMSNELKELLGELPEPRRQRLLARILKANPRGGTVLE